MSTPTGLDTLERNDVNAAIDLVRARSGALEEWEWAVLLQLQDDPDELQRRLDAEGLC